MGTDIHAFIEYVGPEGEYLSLAPGELKLNRDNRLFNAIAFGDGGITDDLPFPPRGLPPDCSDDVREAFLIDADEYREIVASLGDDESGEYEDEDLAADLPDWLQAEYRENNRLPNPDLHTSSWVTLSELEASLRKAGLKLEDLEPDIRAAVGSMRALVRDVGDDHVRLVFWFDG